ncbi:hypothetical protein KVG29_09750 [Caldicoprobacter algeriensis]|nr:hypothetical protein [Caldicoprobacter algeriensis]MCM8901502.1 hypothetical protein [Caldicoprobacter algeriensis]
MAYFDSIKPIAYETLEQYAMQNPVIKNRSGRQEVIKALINEYLLNVK